MVQFFNKDKRFVAISHDLEVFNIELEKDWTLLQPLVPKKSIGRQRKEVKFHLHTPILEKRKNLRFLLI
jgi:hypothetical protein